ncbi:hypothetical protein GCM10011591_35510 [Nocardia camponoti]|uniref:Uncharacterized protein n=1 Tax=Nocardia camponoti TaxID=1616106 RepID=A0A917QNP9_9NOCA|nr:hypothetical protein GCM10011591_35510 [Nocardia camponoti]
MHGAAAGWVPAFVDDAPVDDVLGAMLVDFDTVVVWLVDCAEVAVVDVTVSVPGESPPRATAMTNQITTMSATTISPIASARRRQ